MDTKFHQILHFSLSCLLTAYLFQLCYSTQEFSLYHFQLLVDWTRGRNIIISSAAANANALRGPYDIINLSVVLLGFSMEKAKAAISKNCRFPWNPFLFFGYTKVPFLSFYCMFMSQLYWIYTGHYWKMP